MCILDTLLTLRMIDRRCFWAKVLAISYGDIKKKTDKSDAGKMLFYSVNKGVEERSVVFCKAFPAFTPSAKTWHGLNPIHQHRPSAAAASSALICMDYGEAFQSTERARAKEEKSSGVERCGGRCTHGKVLLQRVSIVLLQVDRKEVGRGCEVMEAECTHGQWDMETWACDTIRTWKNTIPNVDFRMLSETLTHAVLDKRGCKMWINLF